VSGRYLFSLDLEDPRDALAGGERHPARVPPLTEAFLAFLRRHDGRGTFFTVGSVARRHPELLRAIAAAGHEIGCHSDAHLRLHQQDPRGFRDDLRRNLDAIDAAVAVPVRGYRAPCFSLTRNTRWAYEILAELGFTYSSSVLPARNPIGGWPGFGPAPRMIDGIIELPVTLLPWPRVPMGGVYFRALPRALLRRGLSACLRRGQPVLAYHHPYDIDTAQGFAHPDFARWSPPGLLMRMGRAQLLARLEMAAQLGFRFEAYDRYAQEAPHGARSGPEE
jgi:polysaccharide deacetylase family protein (PEP-CTERM system associated)